MRLVFAGSPQVALPSLEYLLESSHEVLAVLSRPDAPCGRGRKLNASPVSQRAQAAGLELYQPHSLRDNPEAVQYLRQLQPDLGVVVAYGAILPPEILEIPRFGWINIHFSLLPRWRGAAPVQRGIEAGDETGGITVFRLEAGLDTGPVYANLPYTFPPQDSAGQVLEELSLLSPQVLATSLEKIAADLEPEPQTEDGVTYAAQLHPLQGEIDWARPALEIANHVRGFTPSPGAWTLWRGHRMKVGVFDLEAQPQACPSLAQAQLQPGQIFSTRRAVWVGTGTEPLCLTTVAPAGKKHLHAVDWARGAHLEPGMVLGE